MLNNPKTVTMKVGIIWASITMTYYILSLGKLPGYLLHNNIINGCMELIIIPLAFISGKSWFKRTKVISGLDFSNCLFFSF